MRPPRSPAKCIHQVALYTSPSDADGAALPLAAPPPTRCRHHPSPSPAPSLRSTLDGPLASTATADAPARATQRPVPGTAHAPLGSPVVEQAVALSPRPPATLAAPPDAFMPSPRPSAVLAPPVATDTAPSDSPRHASGAAAAAFAPPAGGMPRAGVPAQARLCGVLSQIDVVRFIDRKERARHEHNRSSGGHGFPLLHRSVKELGLAGFAPAEIPPSPSTTSSENSELLGRGSAAVRTTLAQGSVSTLEALRRMCMARDSGIGILTPSGTLRSHLSAANLRGLAPGRFHTLLMPVDEFLQKQPLLQPTAAAASVASPEVCIQADHLQMRHEVERVALLHVNMQTQLDSLALAFWCEHLHAH